jgi:hypothetical protein
METETNKAQKPVKRESTRMHQKQTIWQIFLPIGLFSVAIIVLCIMVVFNAGSNPTGNQHFANISTMYLLIPPLIGSLPIIILLIGFIYLLSKIFPYITTYSALIQEKLAMVREYINMGMNGISKPFIHGPAYASSIKALFTEIIKGLRRLTHYE